MDRCISLGTAGDAVLDAMLLQKAQFLCSRPYYLDVIVTYLKEVFTETLKKCILCVKKKMAF